MKHAFSVLLCSLMLTMSPAIMATDAVIGTWKTESTDEGYLHVTFEACDNKLCGKITGAFNLEDAANDSYEHLDKLMVWDMAENGPAKWSGGKIWDPSKDKTYKSKMSLKGDVLSVSGCVLLICRSQDWVRVNN